MRSASVPASPPQGRSEGSTSGTPSYVTHDQDEALAVS
ncbi:hypothetical protein SAMCCGM7_pC0791 (plasmid) [Sinorhizobium americanum CCGM7]|nr:hypothetical protein SAMCCGM7_pC0791 [Sinorhizobium americanum CCGM7]